MTSVKPILMSLIGLLFVFTSMTASAESGPNYSHTGDTHISSVRIIDGLGNEAVDNQDILVIDGKISAIADGGTLIAPEGALTIDGSGLTAMPGLIDMHVHLRGGWTGGHTLTEKYTAGREDAEVQQTLSAFLYAGV